MRRALWRPCSTAREPSDTAAPFLSCLKFILSATALLGVAAGSTQAAGSPGLANGERAFLRHHDVDGVVVHEAKIEARSER